VAFPGQQMSLRGPKPAIHGGLIPREMKVAQRVASVPVCGTKSISMPLRFTRPKDVIGRLNRLHQLYGIVCRRFAICRNGSSVGVRGRMGARMAD